MGESVHVFLLASNIASDLWFANKSVHLLPLLPHGIFSPPVCLYHLPCVHVLLYLFSFIRTSVKLVYGPTSPI
jgi:hypothetical protein